MLNHELRNRCNLRSCNLFTTLPVHLIQKQFVQDTYLEYRYHPINVNWEISVSIFQDGNDAGDCLSPVIPVCDGIFIRFVNESQWRALELCSQIQP